MNKNFVHLNITVTVNQDSGYWGEPGGREDVSVTMPVALFDNTKFSVWLKEMIEAAQVKLHSELAAEEAKRKLEEENKE